MGNVSKAAYRLLYVGKKCIRIGEEFIKNYDNDYDIGFVVKVDIEYLTELHDLHSDLPFLPERIKINKCNKLVCSLYCCSHNEHKASIKTWSKTKKSS